MKPSGFAKKISQQNDIVFNAGKSTGEQFASDCFAIAMKRHGISKNTIIEVAKDAMKIGNQCGAVFNVTTDNCADVAQEHFDEPLRWIFGENFTPFSERYEWIKKIRY